MFWLFVFGMIHVWFIWYGDILVLYSVAGAIAFIAWRWSVRNLLITGIALLLVKLILAGWMFASLRGLEHAASAPNASASVRQEWQAKQEEMTFPSPQTQLDGYRGRLQRHAYGPLEWLWRSLTRWERQPMLRTAP